MPSAFGSRSVPSLGEGLLLFAAVCFLLHRMVSLVGVARGDVKHKRDCFDAKANCFDLSFMSQRHALKGRWRTDRRGPMSSNSVTASSCMYFRSRHLRPHPSASPRARYFASLPLLSPLPSAHGPSRRARGQFAVPLSMAYFLGDILWYCVPKRDWLILLHHITLIYCHYPVGSMAGATLYGLGDPALAIRVSFTGRMRT